MSPAYLRPNDKKELIFYNSCDTESLYKYSDNGLTKTGFNICVSSCKNLNPIAYIYDDGTN